MPLNHDLNTSRSSHPSLHLKLWQGIRLTRSPRSFLNFPNECLLLSGRLSYILLTFPRFFLEGLQCPELPRVPTAPPSTPPRLLLLHTTPRASSDPLVVILTNKFPMTYWGRTLSPHVPLTLPPDHLATYALFNPPRSVTCDIHSPRIINPFCKSF